MTVINRPFRVRRMQKFLKVMQPEVETGILDVGGYAFNWGLIGERGRVTLLNLSPPPATGVRDPDFSYRQGDGTHLEYADAAYDITYSNSVIEHLSSYDQQVKFASEMRRVGRSVWCQTPAREFFIEPHYVAPFIHYLPKSWQRRLARNFSLWGLISRPSGEAVQKMVEELRLLTYAEMQALFPDCEILRERFLFMTKCYIAVRKG